MFINYRCMALLRISHRYCQRNFRLGNEKVKFYGTLANVKRSQIKNFLKKTNYSFIINRTVVSEVNPEIKLVEMALSATDPNSFCRPDLAVTTHLHLDLKIDFVRKILDGYVVLDVEKVGETNFLILDVHALVILSITSVTDDSRLDYCVEKGVDYGSKLSIKLPDSPITDGIKTKYKIRIDYRTSQDSSALQWLEPAQTAGKRHPYMFSQNQAVNARSMVPCQDTPSVKTTYSADIKAPAEITVLMSALRTEVEEDNSSKVYKFNQPVLVPSYLIAIVAGDIVSKQIGPRSHVWSEKELIDQCAYEFADTETFIKTAEEFCGPYVWGIYDLLILPPSFPYGGMENPCLTFVTPTLLAGDRSLANVVVHEISHSWTGNLVTNKTYEHFWLNEGFTVFLERKIIGKLYGDKMRHFEALDGLLKLKMEIKTLGENDEMTKLNPQCNGINPDDTYNQIPYEKGHTFLFYLEELLGGPKVFDLYLKSYIEKFKYKSLNTSDWKEHLFSYFSDKKSVLDKVDWETWIHKSGFPPVIPNYDTSLKEVCDNLVQKWTSEDKNTASFSKNDIENWLPLQKATFLADLVLHSKVLSVDQLVLMNQLYEFDSTNNADIKSNWLQLCIKSHWKDKVNKALEFATTYNRMKYSRPIFRGLYAWEEMRQQAIDEYLAKKDTMFFVARENIARDLHLIKS